MHVHVASPEGDAKFWLEPLVELAMHRGLAAHQVSEIREIIEERKNELSSAWREHMRR